MKEEFFELRACIDGDEKHLIFAARQTIEIGRDKRCQLVVDDPAISPRLALLSKKGASGLVLETVNADANVNFSLNGQVVAPPVAFREGETLAFGRTTLTWRTLPAGEYPTLATERRKSSSRLLAELAEQSPSARYAKETEIGRGGGGRIFAATDKFLQRKVALKVLRDRDDSASQTRFIREARITGTLQHPSIVPVHELSTDQHGHAFYTMKLAQGMTLLQVLHDLAAGEVAAQEKYRLSTLLTIFQKVCDAVAFAHSQVRPIIHRDLKPENIMVGDYGEVLVMDWGAAKVVDNDRAILGTERSVETGDNCKPQPGEEFFTLPGSIMGTPGYMAPEQAVGRAASADERTDVYALGAILYAMLTLEAPLLLTPADVRNFEERAAKGDKVDRAWREHVASLLANRTFRPKHGHLPREAVPESLAAVALKAMAFRPDDRFANVKELQADVSAYQSGFATSAENARAWTHLRLLIRRNKLLFGSMAAIFAILCSATVISLHQRKTAIDSAKALEQTLHGASLADLEVARQRFRAGAWREGIALLGRSLSFWPDNREAANYLLSAVAFGRGDRDKLPTYGIHHNGAIINAAFSPDGRHFATASYDHTAKIWDAKTGVQVGKTLQGASPCIIARFSPNGHELVTGGEDGVVRLWDARTGVLLIKPLRHGRPDLDPLSNIGACVFSSDGKRILTASFDHTARIWDAETGKELAQLVNPQRVSDATFSPDDTRILTSYWYGGAMLWDAATFKPIGTPMEHAATVKRSRFTPDGNLVVTSSLDKTARVWDGHTGKPLSPPLLHGDFV